MKKFLAILLIFTMLISSSSGVFAKSKGNDKDKHNKNEDKAQVLYDLGLFKGTSSTSFVPDLDSLSTRAQAIVLIGTSLGWPKADITSVPGYEDVPAWAAPYVAYALENNITKGTGKNKFGADLHVTQRMIYTWYYRALLFTEDSWENSDFLVSAGLITQDQANQMKAEITGQTDSSVIRDLIVSIMFDSMQWKEKGSNQRLIQKLVNSSKVSWKKAKDCGLLPNEELTFKVNANSLKAISVEFSEALNASSVTSTLFDVKVDGVAKTFGTDFVLETIDKTVYVIFTNLLAPSSTVSINVKEGIKTVDGISVTAATQTAVVNDSVSPLIKTVEVTNPNTVKIYFSEPMNIVTGTLVQEDILIDGIKAIGTSSFNASKTMLTLELATAITGGSHVMGINAGLTDFAGLKTIAYQKPFTLSIDSTTPSIVSVTAVERDHIVIVFDEAINKTEGYILVGQTQYPVTAGIVDGSTVNLHLTVPLTTESAITGTILTIKGIKDLSNNMIDTTVGKQFIFKASADTTPPTALVTLLADKTIAIQFSEVIDAFTFADYTLVDSNNVSVSSSVSYNFNDKKAIITFSTAPTIGTGYTLTILDTVLDNSVYQNKFIPKSFPLLVNN